MDSPILIVEAIEKRFGGVAALRNVSLAVESGRALALIGENGAGKSTLVKILTGIHNFDSGNIKFCGEEVHFTTPFDAARAGIAAIQQEPSMFDELTIAENIFVGNQPKTHILGRVDWKKMTERAHELLDVVGLSFNPNELIQNLSVAERHLVSLARALSTDARLIIFDEPTAALSKVEIEHLYTIIEGLIDQGKAIIFISHKFDEIYRICDDYVVLRDGVSVSAGTLDSTNKNNLIYQMVGRELGEIYPKAETSIGEIVLNVHGLCHPTEFHEIGFNLHKGEILGFYGLVGAGRTEVLEAVFGLKALARGRIEIEGTPVVISSPRKAMELGLAFVPEDRQANGAIQNFSITKNITLPILERVAKFGIISSRFEREVARQHVEMLEVKNNSVEQTLDELSGGNQQKVVLAKWLAISPKIIFFDEPTKGIDVGTKSKVHEIIGALVREGLAVVLISSELEEVLAVSDRIIVMHQGRITAQFSRNEFSSTSVIKAATGNSDSSLDIEREI